MTTGSFLMNARKIVHAYNKLCEPLISEYELPQVSFDILMFLTNNPEYSTAQEISEFRNIKKNLVSVHVDKLVKAGLLERTAVLGDRRKISLSCTEKAAPIINAGTELQKKFYQELTAGISCEKWKIFSEIFESIESNAEHIVKEQ